MDRPLSEQSFANDLADLTGRLFPVGFALAIGCVIAQGLLLPLFSLEIALIANLYAHAFFVVTLTDFGLRSWRVAVPRLSQSFGVGAIGGAILLVPMLLFWLPTTAAQPLARWPWLVVGWAVITGVALPGRIATRLRGERFIALSWWQTPLLMLPFGTVIAVLDLPVWLCEGECGGGLFDGGLIVLPIVGATLFLASVSCALLSALGGRTERVEDAG